MAVGGDSTANRPFSLRDLISKRTVEGFDIFISGREYAKDLSEYPALLQDRAIFARTDPTRASSSGKGLRRCDAKVQNRNLVSAFSKYGLSPQEEPSEEVDGKISHIANSETETYIHHELGEAFEGEKIGDEWKSLVDLSSSQQGRTLCTRRKGRALGHLRKGHAQIHHQNPERRLARILYGIPRRIEEDHIP